MICNINEEDDIAKLHCYMCGKGQKIFDTLTEEQKTFVYAVVGCIVSDHKREIAMIHRRYETLISDLGGTTDERVQDS